MDSEGKSGFVQIYMRFNWLELVTSLIFNNKKSKSGYKKKPV